MLAVRRALRLCQRVTNVRVSRRGCVGAVPVDDIVNGLTEEQVQVSTHLVTKPGAEAREMCQRFQLTLFKFRREAGLAWAGLACMMTFDTILGT